MQIVTVGSFSAVKWEAVARALALGKPGEAEVRIPGGAVSSGVPEQPFGEAELTFGAINRAVGALRVTPEAEFGLGVESALVSADPSFHLDVRADDSDVFYDVAEVVLYKRVESGFQWVVSARSAALPCPLKYVRASLAASRRKSAGAFYAEHMGCSGGDWQAHATGGRLTRCDLLVQPILAVLALGVSRW